MARIVTTTGNDHVDGESREDDIVITGLGSDYVHGGGGSDSFDLGYASSISAFRWAQPDFDSLDYRATWIKADQATDTSVRIEADLQAGTILKYGDGGILFGTDRVTSVDNIYGTQSTDRLLGRDFWASESFQGMGGDDRIDGRGGEDWLVFGYPITSGIDVKMAAGIVTSSGPDIGKDTLRQVEAIRGTSLADTFDATGYGATSTNRNSFGLGWNMFATGGGDDTITGNGQTILLYDLVGGAVTIDLSGLSSVSATDRIVTGFTPDANPATPDGGDILVSGVYAVYSGSFADRLIGGGRVNTLGAAAADVLSGDTSYEQFRGQGGNDTIDGGTGLDRAEFRTGNPIARGVTIDLAAGKVVGDAIVLGTDTLRNVESVRGTFLDDVYDARGFTLSNAATRSVNSGDVMQRVPTGEALPSQAYNEFVANAGTDVVIGNGATRVFVDPTVATLDGISTIAVFTSAQSGHAEYGLTDGGLGRITFSGTASFRSGLGNDSVTGAAGFQQLIGGFGDDTLRGGDGADILYGYSGDLAFQNHTTLYTDDDMLYGDAGNDLLRADDGDDKLNGGSGNDTLSGGRGDDTYYLHDSGDDISGETSDVTGGIDLVITKVDYSATRDYVENLTAATGTAAIALTGNQLANVLTGNDGRNILNGMDGADVLRGGAGADALTGGAGADRFIYGAARESTSSALDRIADFTRGTDKLDLSHLDGNSGLTGQQDFAFIGSKAFSTNATGQLRFALESGKVMLYGSTDADATAEFAVQVGGATTLSASDLLL
ncbi:MAG TPA: calcium-binding protein [Ramlibacter sp.]|jgi:Ca2+-binding RTX toxin-like protein